MIRTRSLGLNHKYALITCQHSALIGGKNLLSSPLSRYACFYVKLWALRQSFKRCSWLGCVILNHEKVTWVEVWSTRLMDLQNSCVDIWRNFYWLPHYVYQWWGSMIFVFVKHSPRPVLSIPRLKFLISSICDVTWFCRHVLDRFVLLHHWSSLLFPVFLFCPDKRAKPCSDSHHAHARRLQGLFEDQSGQPPLQQVRSFFRVSAGS